METQLALDYFGVGVFLSVGALASYLLNRLSLSTKDKLFFNYLILLTCLCLPLFPEANVPDLFPKPQIWNNFSGSFNTGSSPAIHLAQQPVLDVSIATHFLILLSLSGLFFGVIKVLLSVVRLHSLVRNSHSFKSIGNVNIYFSEKIGVPFSFRGLRNLYAIIPIGFLSHPADLRIAIRHELQHHRQKDTILVYLQTFLNSFFFWQPLLRWWQQGISELQELACDEAVIGRSALSSYAYGDCLIRAAELNANTHRHLAGTTGMAMSCSHLKRRILMLKNSKTPSSKGATLIGTLSLLLVLVAALSFGNGFSDFRISATQAKRMADKASTTTTIPVPINETVLAQLNLYLGTEKGRKFIRASLERMKTYNALIDEQTQAYGLPNELKAIAMIESGFQNLDETGNPQKGAGLWQFVPGTARNYGLTVKAGKDERLDVSKETDAAMRLLGALYYRFKDWHLALLAYNAGERAVQLGINQTGSRNAWDLIANGYTNDENYLSKILAGIIILKNPAMVR